MEYMVIGGVSLFIYYIISSFLFPNIQFYNELIDLKYNPTWMLIMQQIKFITIGFILKKMNLI